MALYFFLIISIITLIVSIVPALILFENPFQNPEAVAYIHRWLFDPMHIKNTLFWGTVVMLTQFAIQISDKFGPRNLWRMITGKYHMPSKEDRIFMFLDLKSSTTIAEQLGEELYHEFLKDVFADITDPIMANKAEIYQYVGDEVVISWPKSASGNMEDSLNCFFEIQSCLAAQQSKYDTKYGIQPAFKAGAHVGKVIVGEVGIIKRDITYSGDVLNTTARIQGKCNELEASLLISQKLSQEIDSGAVSYKMNSRGYIPLKGKAEKIELMAVSKL